MKEYLVKETDEIIEWRNSDRLIDREGGPAVEYKNHGWKYWYRKGKLHREDGPAIERKDFKTWLINGNRHREDGPAHIDLITGGVQYWIDGKEYTELEYLKLGYTIEKNGNRYKLVKI